MFNIFKPSLASSSAETMKGYKITDNKRTRRIGIGANSLKMLKDKAKLKFPIKDLCIYHSTDGVEVCDEDYFRTLEAQTLFIVAGPDEIVTTDADLETEKAEQNSPLLKVAAIINNFIEKNPERFREMVAEYEKSREQVQQIQKTEKSPKKSLDINETANKVHLSLKSEHLEWFEGLEKRCNTKEEAMAKRAQDRIRGYYYKTKDDLTHNKLYRTNSKARKIIDSLLEKFRYLLVGCEFFSMIFNRKHKKKHNFLQQKLSEENEAVEDAEDDIDSRSTFPNKRLKQIIKDYTVQHELLDEWTVSLCSDVGDFYCQGANSSQASDTKKCTMNHAINPYATRENFILFQVWNLDHQIELSRRILPTLIDNVRELVENPDRRCELHKKENVLDISVLEYFLEIFSLKNLKLVHIVCHEKTQRASKSNGRLICKKCHEYKIVEELMDVQCAEDEIDGLY